MYFPIIPHKIKARPVSLLICRKFGQTFQDIFQCRVELLDDFVAQGFVQIVVVFVRQKLVIVFAHTLKAEVDKVEGRQTKEEEWVEICEYMELYYNKRRRHSALGYAIRKKSTGR
jgi:transposase InsO family protein